LLRVLHDLIMTAAFVYLLPHAELPYFKIGVAKDIPNRFRQIRPGLYGLAVQSAQALETSTYSQSLALESVLHKVFAKWSISAGVAFSLDLPTEGGSEWFSQCCYARVCEFIEHLEDCVDYRHVSSREIAALFESAHPDKRRRTSMSLFEKRMIMAAEITANPMGCQSSGGLS
jgi:hypothetical protein